MLRAFSLPPAYYNQKQRLQVVAAGIGTLGQQSDVGGDTTTRLETRYLTNFWVDCQGLVLAFHNYKIGSGTGEADGANAITVSAAIETVSSTGTINQSAVSKPVLFGGQLSRQIDPGAALAFSDVLGSDFGPSQTPQAYLRTNVIYTAGQFVPVGRPALQGGSLEQAYKSSNSSTQIYGTGNLAAGTNGVTTSYGYGPLAVLGYPTTAYPSVVVLGDSIPDGNGDSATGNGAGARGYAARGLAAALIPYTKLTRPSDTPAMNKRSVAWRKFAVLPFHTHMICTLGINQLGPTDPTVQLAYLQDTWLTAKRAGLRVYQTLISCQTTSTDSWATTENQTVDTTFSAHRASVNAGIVAAYQSGLIDGYLDPGSAWEDPNNPGKFVVNGTANYATSDGTHPTATFHAAGGAIVAAYASAKFF